MQTTVDLNEYQKSALVTWDAGKFRDHELARLYLALKLSGEAGEAAEKCGKLIRDKDGLMAVSAEDAHALKLELGDVLWYLAVLAHELGFTLEHVAISNIHKLRDRQARGVLKGSGDNR